MVYSTFLSKITIQIELAMKEILKRILVLVSAGLVVIQQNPTHKQLKITNEFSDITSQTFI